MICDKCGKIISDGSKFCNECGAAVESFGKNSMWNVDDGFDDADGVDIDRGRTVDVNASNLNKGIFEDVDFDDDIDDDMDVDDMDDDFDIENIGSSRRNPHNRGTKRTGQNNRTGNNRIGQNNRTQNNRTQNNGTGQNNRAQNNGTQNNRAQNNGTGQNNRTQNNRLQNNKSQNNRPENNRYQNDRYQNNRSQNNRPQNSKPKNNEKKKSSGNSYLAVIIAAIIIVVAAAVVVGFIIFNSYRDSKMEDFAGRIDEYKQAMIDSDSIFGEYQQLLEEAQQAFKDGDIGAFNGLNKKMQDAMEKMLGESDSHQELSELKETYDAIFAKYKITDDYKETYDDVMKRLEQAIASRNENEARQIGKDLETLKNNLSVENQNLVQTAINEINRMDITHANDAEQKTFEEYKEKVDALMAEENYAQALAVLDSWEEMAKLTEERIKESESKERERRESESRAKRESEEAEKAKQTETETESEQQQPEQPQPTGGSYVIPGSDSRYLTEDEITPLSAWDKKLARNEIYARHGRKFSDADLQAYFNSQSWYNGTIEPSQFSESVLNDFERKNVALIRSLE